MRYFKFQYGLEQTLIESRAVNYLAEHIKNLFTRAY